MESWCAKEVSRHSVLPNEKAARAERIIYAGYNPVFADQGWHPLGCAATDLRRNIGRRGVLRAGGRRGEAGEKEQQRCNEGERRRPTSAQTRHGRPILFEQKTG